MSCPELSDQSIVKLQQHAWPGNIRELSHLMERVLFTCKQTIITPHELMLEEVEEVSASFDHSTLTMDEIEQQALLSRLKFHRGNATETAKSLGLSRSGFYRRMSKYESDTNEQS